MWYIYNLIENINIKANFSIKINYETYMLMYNTVDLGVLSYNNIYIVIAKMTHQ